MYCICSVTLASLVRHFFSYTVGNRQLLESWRIKMWALTSVQPPCTQTVFFVTCGLVWGEVSLDFFHSLEAACRCEFGVIF